MVETIEFVCCGCGEVLREVAEWQGGVPRTMEDGVTVHVHQKCACENCLHAHDFFFVELAWRYA